MKQFVDFKKWLQEQLNSIQAGFNVTNERNINSDFINKEVVVSQLAGSVYDESANIPYQIDIFASDVENAINVFTSLAKKQNNKPFTSIVNEGTEESPSFKNYSVIPYFQTPVVMEKDLSMGSDHYARIVCFVNLVILFEISNVKKITIGTEEISFLSGTLAYTTELQSNRVSGAQLNLSKARTASTSLCFKMINKDTIFTEKLFKIAIGELPRNTYFSVKIELTNGRFATLNMVVGSSTLSFARQQLASYDVAMYLYDNRGDS